MWELDYKESWARRIDAFELWCLIDSWESLGQQGDPPVHPKGDQSWVFIGRTDVEGEIPVVWPLDVKSWLIWKDPDAGKDWRQEEKGTTEDEMVGWHHQTQWTWVWVGSGSWWWTGRPGMLQSLGSQSWTGLSDWTEPLFYGLFDSCFRLVFREIGLP